MLKPTIYKKTKEGFTKIVSLDSYQDAKNKLRILKSAFPRTTFVLLPLNEEFITKQDFEEKLHSIAEYK